MATADPPPQGQTGSTDPSGPGKMTSHEKTIGHRGIDPTGETTYKKTPSSALRGAIQLGIAHTVGSLTQKPERDVLMQDFEVVESIVFPSEGTNLTPAHHYMDFRFKTYAPIAFRYFRDMYGIRPDDYMCSLCSEPLIELSNSGASGSLFYVSSDDEFIIKTVQFKEAEFLQKLLPGYFLNLNQNKRTLLPKFYGLYCIQAGGKNIRLVVMNNLLPRAIPMHLKFDLKGSTYKRQASARERAKPSPTYKDLDFRQDLPEGLLLEPEHYNALCKTIQRDCLLLQSFKIMDYSLLVGLHRLEQGRDEVPTTVPDAPRRAPTVRALYCTAMEAIQAEATGASSDQCHDHLGGIPAFSKGERVILFIGIIDILQSYRLVKKLEHSWKALVHDGDTVSVHRPGFYADRFQRFMCSMVFKRIPRELKTSPSKRSRAGPQTLRRANMAAAAARLPPGQSNPQPPPLAQPNDRVQPQETPQAPAQSPDTLPPVHSKDSDRGSGMQAACPDLLLATRAQDNITSTDTSCATTTNTTTTTTNTNTTTNTKVTAPLAVEEIVEPLHIAPDSKKAKDTTVANASMPSLSIQSRGEGEPRVS